MKKSFFPLRRNVAMIIFFHTAIVLLVALICEALPNEYALITGGGVVFTVVMAIFTARNICRCIIEDFEQRTKDFEMVSSSLQKTSSLLRVQKKELARCVENLYRYSEVMGKLAADINAASQEPAMPRDIQEISDTEPPISDKRVVTRGGGHD